VWVILGSGIVEGFILALVAVGFTIIYNGTQVVNFANGQMMIAGAYTVWYLAAVRHWELYLSIAAGVLVGAALGIVSDKLFIAPLRRAPLLSQVIMLLALANMLDGGFLQLFGPNTRNSPNYASSIGIVPFLNWSATDLTIVCATTLVVGLLVAFLFLTDRGTWMRAAANNPVGASLVGISPRSMTLAAWSIGGGLTALAGILIIPKLVLTPAEGPTLTFLGFAAVVLGGFGSLSGAIFGGLVIGIAQQLVAGWLSAGYEPLVSLIIMLLVLSVRPAGLFGDRGAQ
jgi:branched-chain amino acid transport system permease protein